MRAEHVTDSAAAKQEPHGAENRFEWIDVDQHRHNHRPANEDRHAVLQAVTPAPQPMAAPKDSQHNDARYKRRDVFKSGQERFDIVGDLLRGDDKHGDRERKCCIDESFQPRHRNATQSESGEPRKRIQIRRQTGRDFVCAFVHLAAILPQLSAVGEAGSFPTGSAFNSRQFYGLGHNTK